MYTVAFQHDPRWLRVLGLSSFCPFVTDACHNLTGLCFSLHDLLDRSSVPGHRSASGLVVSRCWMGKVVQSAWLSQARDRICDTDGGCHLVGAWVLLMEDRGTDARVCGGGDNWFGKVE